LASRNPPPAYYYGVWLKHLAFLERSGLSTTPRVVAELGPGDALGVGIAALLSGAERYYALDVIAHAAQAENLAALDVIAGLLRTRAARPKKGWPDFDALLDERLFPGSVLTEARLAASLTPERLDAIARQLRGETRDADPVRLQYRVPWFADGVVEEGSVDLVLSQAVLEHIDDIEHTYAALYRWLRPGGVMSHQIDFGCHELTREFNGYRAIPEPVWTLMRGRRPYFINRIPASEHVRVMERCGFEVLSVQNHLRDDGIDRGKLASRWRDLGDEDLRSAEMFVQARKPVRAG
jgi:SAM-dependent methyltransferase